MKYDTSLKCEGCLNAVRKGLNDELGEGQWEVDLSGAVKTLAVAETVAFEQLQDIFQKAGHSIIRQEA